VVKEADKPGDSVLACTPLAISMSCLTGQSTWLVRGQATAESWYNQRDSRVSAVLACRLMYVFSSVDMTDSLEFGH